MTSQASADMSAPRRSRIVWALGAAAYAVILLGLAVVGLIRYGIPDLINYCRGGKVWAWIVATLTAASLRPIGLEAPYAWALRHLEAEAARDEERYAAAWFWLTSDAS